MYSILETGFAVSAWGFLMYTSIFSWALPVFCLDQIMFFILSSHFDLLNLTILNY
jgi:hypothetical protein